MSLCFRNHHSVFERPLVVSSFAILLSLEEKVGGATEVKVGGASVQVLR